MSHRFLLRALALGLVLALVGTAIAVAATRPPRNVGLRMIGGVSFKINRYVKDSVRFNKDVTVARAGGNLVVRNRTDEPHTLSFVPRSRVPNTSRKINNCGAPGTICFSLGNAHQIDQNGNPQKPVVDINKPGIDSATTQGDSWVFNPHQTRVLKISAPRGRNLHYICAIHPWMQGVLKVR